MLDVVQGTVVPPVATRKGIPNKNRSTTPTRFRSKPKIVNFAHPFFFNFADRARSALRAISRRRSAVNFFARALKYSASSSRFDRATGQG